MEGRRARPQEIARGGYAALQRGTPLEILPPAFCPLFRCKAVKLLCVKDHPEPVGPTVDGSTGVVCGHRTQSQTIRRQSGGFDNEPRQQTEQPYSQRPRRPIGIPYWPLWSQGFKRRLQSPRGCRSACWLRDSPSLFTHGHV
jgi:hypothetical protein